jgi:hypothetical protein
MNNKNLRSAAVAGLALLMLVGCTSLESVPIDRSKPESLRFQLTVGESVIVRLHGGEQRQFRIVALEDDAIVGRDERIAYSDIDLVDVKYVDYKGTAQATGAVALLAAIVIGSAILDSESEEPVSQAPCRTDGSGGMICRPK